MMASLWLFNLITSHLKKGYAFGVENLLSDHCTIDLTLGVSGVGISDQLNTL